MSPVLDFSPSADSTYTLANLRDLFRAEIKTDPTGRIWNDDTVNLYANQAYLKLQRDGQFKWSANQAGEQTVTFDGSREYALADDFGTVDFVQLDNTQGNTRLRSSDFSSVIRRNPQNTTGNPSYYYVRGANIGFDPVPTGNTATLYYNKILPYLQENTDYMLLGNNFAPAIVKYMCYLAWSSPRGNAQEAINKLAQYNEELKTLQLTYLLRDMGGLTYTLPRRGMNRSATAIYDR